MKSKVKPLVLGPIVRGVENDLSKNAIRIWGKAKMGKRDTYLVARYSKIDGEYSEAITVLLDKQYGGCGMIEISELDPGCSYVYQIGYTNDIGVLEWPMAPSGRFKTEDDSSVLNFCFGSCRLLAKVGPLKFFGSGHSTDKIYDIIKRQDPDFWLEIGDQVYFDYMGTIDRAKTIKDMRKRYDLSWSYPHQKYLYANCPVYGMCDDHDLHRNNTDYKKRQAEPDVWNYGLQVFREHQSLRGPSDKGPLWFSFIRKNATFFICDSRSERRDNTIISDEQMDAIHDWVNNPNHASLYKFFVSPTPVISQDNDDSWYGYPIQQRQLIETLLQNTDVYILTGDAHVCRTGVYQVHNDLGDTNRQVIEIMSSGLSAAACDRGKHYDRSIGSFQPDYDKKNDFPMVVDNTEKGGLKFVTNYSTDGFPKKHTSLVKHLVKGGTDHVVTNVLVTQDSIQIKVLNEKDEVLNQLSLTRGQYV